jgi:aerobic-type carbon monoxide dehydrogenase small subunit (CoxS/CutS family)
MVKEKERGEYGKLSRIRTAKAMSADDMSASTVTLAQTSLASVDMEIVNLTVNGRKCQLRVEPNWPLRDVLREKLGLTSLKDFCNGYGACGSCTVIMDGRPVLSCMLLAAECDGAIIETAEGIADAKHPLIEAYITNWTVQCGYCMPGFLVTANLCRCGTYPAQIKAVQEAAKKLREKK